MGSYLFRGGGASSAVVQHRPAARVTIPRNDDGTADWQSVLLDDDAVPPGVKAAVERWHATWEIGMPYGGGQVDLFRAGNSAWTPDAITRHLNAAIAAEAVNPPLLTDPLLPCPLGMIPDHVVATMDTYGGPSYAVQSDLEGRAITIDEFLQAFGGMEAVAPTFHVAYECGADVAWSFFWQPTAESPWWALHFSGVTD